MNSNFGGLDVLGINRGKLLVYASNQTSCRRRLKTVSTAVEKTARTLKLDVEVLTLKSKRAPIYVYYKDGDEEPVPLYCDKNKEHDTEQVCRALRSMIFVLSFHPKYSALRKIRRKIIQFS
ncbi:MAG: hypothetical protein QHH12_00200 [Candidatus Bathyarchaeota archaeon]|nr:hypothetical protein [Candidatus Bathyarchaeota archaeon A05DMB-3]MDH7606178.1 hypothetical protein [Candidatus Bathyarchaeota archaeon]